MPNTILRALRAHAAADPSRIALQGDQHCLDYATLSQQIDSLAAWLTTEGMRRAALCGGNSPQWLVADLAAWQAGVALVPLPAFFSSVQQEHALREAGIECLLVCGAAALPPTVLAVGDTPVPGIRWVRIAALAEPGALPPGTCKITYTSGTTGQPKGVCLDTSMLEAVSGALATRIHQAAGMVDAVQAHFTLLPLATLLENVAGAYVPLLLGKRVIVRGEAQTGLHGSSQLDLPRLLQTLQQDQPHSLILLPQILRGLVLAAEQGLHLLNSLRFVAVGGATTPPALIRRARALGLPVYEGYGLSECGSVVALNAPGVERIGSVGQVLPHVRVRIDCGAIQVAGNVFPGYLGQPASSADNWLDSGDLGHLDDDGFLYVTGRCKHLLITGYGRNVSPEWVESELTLSPAIAQVMVLGEAQAFLGAIVVPARAAAPEAVARAIADANARLPDYARVRRFLVAAEPFTVGNGLLTDNARLRRDAIASRYDAALATLFATPASVPSQDLAHDVL